MNVRDLTKTECAFLLQLLQDAVRCDSDGKFIQLILSLQLLLPFESFGVLFKAGPKSLFPTAMLAVHVSYPAGFVQEYAARGLSDVDPIVRECLGTGGLCYWGDALRKYEAPRELTDLAADYGFKNGPKGHGYSLGLSNHTATERGVVSFYGLPRSLRSELLLTLVAPFLQEALKHSCRKSFLMSAATGAHPPADRHAGIGTDGSACVPGAGLPEESGRGPHPGERPGQRFDLSPGADPGLFADGAGLTAREREVLQWCAAGKSVWDISEILRISERTVKFHVARIMAKLDAVNRTHAVAIALQEGLITVG